MKMVKLFIKIIGEPIRVKVIRIGVLDNNSSDLVKSVSLEHKA